VAACIGLLAAGCGSAPAASPRTAPQDSASASSPPAASGSSIAPIGVPAPLTGSPVSVAVQRRPVVAVAVGSTPAPRGLDRADIVVEEVTSPVRYVALYQSRDADTVGPVTETRPVDGQLLAVGRPAVAYAGGRPGFVVQLRGSGAVDLGRASHPELYRRSGTAWYVSTAALFGAARGALPALPQLTFAEADDRLATRGVVAARDVTIAPPGSAPTRWTWVPAARAWRSDRGLQVSNVIVQEVGYKRIEPTKGSDATVPSARALGSGTCTVLSGESAVPCQWVRKGPRQLTNYLDAAGVPLRLAAGSSWLLLAPDGTRVIRR